MGMIKIYWFRWANALSWLIRNKIKVVDSYGGDAGAACTRGRVGHGDGLCRTLIYVAPGKKELLHRTIGGDDCHGLWCAWGRRWHSEVYVLACYDSSIHSLPAHSHRRTVSPRPFCLLLGLGDRIASRWSRLDQVECPPTEWQRRWSRYLFHLCRLWGPTRAPSLQSLFIMLMDSLCAISASFCFK